MIIVPLSFSHNTLSFENYAECSLDKETKSRYIIVCIIAIPGLYYMVLDLIFYWLPMCSLQRRYLNSSTTNMYTNILNNKCQKYLKSMNSVSILIAVLLFFSGSLLVRIVVDLIQALPKEVLNLTFALANINSFLNPFNYFINIAEFKIVLKRVCSIIQWSD